MRKTWTILGALGLAATSALAIEVKEPSHLIAEVKGVICTFCAYGARKNMARLDFLDRSQFREGLLMDTEKGAITVAIAKGRSIDFSTMSKSIQKGGYEILAVHLRLQGVVEKRDGATVITHEHNGQVFTLVDEHGDAWDPGALNGKRASVQAVVPEAVLSKTDLSKAPPARVKAAVELKPVEEAE